MVSVQGQTTGIGKMTRFISFGRRARRFLAVTVALITLLVIVGCGSDPEPAPTTVTTQAPTTSTTVAPTSTTVTTQAPTTSTTVAPEPAPLVEPAGSLEDLYITDDTTGRDVMARLSQTEQDCVREGIGDAWYSAFLDLTLTVLVRESAATGVSSFLGCLTEDNVLLMGLALIDANYGRIDPQARECRIAVARANPDMIRVRYAVLRSEMGTIDVEALFSSTKESFDCLSVADQVDVLVRLTTRLDQEDTFSGQDIVDMLDETEVSCLREEIGEELFAGFLEATVTDAFAPSASLLDCISPESQTALFSAFTASRVDGLSEEAVVCMASTVAESPNILAIGFGTLDVDQLNEDELAQLADDAAKPFDCLNEEELLRVLTLPAVVEQ